MFGSLLLHRPSLWEEEDATSWRLQTSEVAEEHDCAAYIMVCGDYLDVCEILPIYLRLWLCSCELRDDGILLGVEETGRVLGS